MENLKAPETKHGVVFVAAARMSLKDIWHLEIGKSISFY